MRLNRTKLAKVADRIGLTRLIATVGRSPCLLVLCHHRIGDIQTAEYDPDVFSATADAFYEQVAYLKSTYEIATLDEALRGPRSWSKGTRILLTFDDGYIDNYTTAFPILRSLGVPATFLLATSFVGTNRVPWWDAIAHMIWKTSRRSIRVPSLTTHVFDLSEGPAKVSCDILRLYRETNNPNPQRVLEELSTSTGIVPPEAGLSRRFLDWDEAREMMHAGMTFGSHSDSHPLMGGMTAEQQRHEAVVSRQKIAEHLQIEPRVFALPCGSYSPETSGVLAEAGYEMSLTTEYGPNPVSGWDPLHVRRVVANYNDRKESARLRLALLTKAGNFPVLVSNV